MKYKWKELKSVLVNEMSGLLKEKFFYHFDEMIIKYAVLSRLEMLTGVNQKTEKNKEMYKKFFFSFCQQRHVNNI